MMRDFTLTTIGSGHAVHYVDDWRYNPGRTVCGRDLPHPIQEPGRGLPLCGVCDRNDDYPTQAQFWAYWTCTDCGIDTWTLGEVHYQVTPSVWEAAYPGYNSEGIGVGDSRPCIGCLEKRLDRELTASDFTLSPTSCVANGQKFHQLHGTESDRLADRILRVSKGVTRP